MCAAHNGDPEESLPSPLFSVRSVIRKRPEEGSDRFQIVSDSKAGWRIETSGERAPAPDFRSAKLAFLMQMSTRGGAAINDPGASKCVNTAAFSESNPLAQASCSTILG